MGTQITPTGIKFDDYDDEQTKPVCSVAGVEPDNDGNISLDLSSINTQISDLDAELLILEQTPNRTLTLSQSATSVNEGDSVIITLTTTNVFNGGRIPYTITSSGIDLNNDFTSPVATTGNFEIQNNSDSLTLTIKEDFLTENLPESFTLTLNAGTNPSVTVNVIDTSQDPTYTITPQYFSVNEGTPLTINTSTTNVPSGTTLYWSVSQPNDFSVDSGSFQVTGTNASSSGSFIVTPTNDETTEGTETFTVSISLTSGGSSVAETSSITINDTSTTPAPSDYQVFTSDGNWSVPSGVTEVKVYVTGHGATGTEGYGAPFTGAQFVGGDTAVARIIIPQIGDAITTPLEEGTVSAGPWISTEVGTGAGTAKSNFRISVQITKLNGGIVTRVFSFGLFGGGLAMPYMIITAYHIHMDNSKPEWLYGLGTSSPNFLKPNTPVEFHTGYAPHRSHPNATESPEYYGSAYHYWRNTGTGANPNQNNVFNVDPNKGLPFNPGVVVIAWGEHL